MPRFDGRTLQGRRNSILVAANDAPELFKNAADYVCDGTADNVEIVAAIDALPATGGVIELTGGIFTISSQINFTNTKRIILRGAGPEVTIVRWLVSQAAPANAMITVGLGLVAPFEHWGQIRDLTLDGNAVAPTLHLTQAAWGAVKQVFMDQTPKAISLNQNCFQNEISNCTLSARSVAAALVPTGVSWDAGCNFVTIDRCRFRNFGTSPGGLGGCIVLPATGGGSSGITIRQNLFEPNSVGIMIFREGFNDVSIENNWFEQCGDALTPTMVIGDSGTGNIPSRITVNGNRVVSGCGLVRFGEISELVVVGNSFSSGFGVSYRRSNGANGLDGYFLAGNRYANVTKPALTIWEGVDLDDEAVFSVDSDGSVRSAANYWFTSGTRVERNRLNINAGDNPYNLAGTMQFNGGAQITGHLSGTASWDPPNIADNVITSTTVTVTGAAIGNTVVVGFSVAVPAGALLVGAVTATNVVTVTLYNRTGAPLDLGPGTLRADVWQH